jgi:hypothetical protein
MATFEWGQGIILSRKGVLDTQICMKGVWPKLDVKIGAVEKGAKGSSNGLVCPFDWAILMGAISTSRSDFVTKLFKKCTDFWIVVELASLVKKNVLSLDTGRVSKEPVMKPCEGSTLGDAGDAIELAGGMIGDQNITGLTIDAFIG